MYILLIIWLLFVFAYVIFNAYGLVQIVAKRFKGDAIGRAVLIYVIVMLAIILVSLFFISNLKWGTNLPKLF